MFLTCTNIFRKYSFITKAVKNLQLNPNLESSFTVKKIYRHFWHVKKKICESFTLDEKVHISKIAPKLFLEQTPVTLASRSFLWRKGKRIGKKVKLIFNDFPFSDVDINDRNDLKIANEAMKLLKKNKKIKEII